MPKANVFLHIFAHLTSLKAADAAKHGVCKELNVKGYSSEVEVWTIIKKNQQRNETGVTPKSRLVIFKRLFGKQVCVEVSYLSKWTKTWKKVEVVYSRNKKKFILCISIN